MVREDQRHGEIKRRERSEIEGDRRQGVIRDMGRSEIRRDQGQGEMPMPSGQDLPYAGLWRRASLPRAPLCMCIRAIMNVCRCVPVCSCVGAGGGPRA